MGITPSLIAAGSSLIGGLGGLFGGSSNAPAPPQGYQPAGQAWTDSILMGEGGGGIPGLSQYNAYAQNMGQAGGIAQNLVNNPYASLYQGRANAAADTGWGVGGAQVGGGMNLMGAGNAMLPYAQSILQTGFDPQNALYNRTQQQVTDQQRAGQSARGIAMSPYGAGLENKALSDFNIDWQNNLLGRQNTAAQGAGYLTNSAGNAINLGQNVSTLGLQTLGQAAALPYATSNTIGGNQLGALGQYGQFGAAAGNQAQQQIDDYLRYMGIGQQAAGVANQGYANQLTANNQQFNQGQTLGRNIGAGIQGLGQWSGFGGGGGSWGANNPGMPGSSYYGPVVP